GHEMLEEIRDCARPGRAFHPSDRAALVPYRMAVRTVGAFGTMQNLAFEVGDGNRRAERGLQGRDQRLRVLLTGEDRAERYSRHEPISSPTICAIFLPAYLPYQPNLHSQHRACLLHERVGIERLGHVQVGADLLSAETIELLAFRREQH